MAWRHAKREVSDARRKEAIRVPNIHAVGTWETKTESK